MHHPTAMRLLLIMSRLLITNLSTVDSQPSYQASPYKEIKNQESTEPFTHKDSKVIYTDQSATNTYNSKSASLLTSARYTYSKQPREFMGFSTPSMLRTNKLNEEDIASSRKLESESRISSGILLENTTATSTHLSTFRYLSTSVETFETEDICHEYGLCSSVQLYRLCYCDSECAFYRDCCKDVNTTHLKTSMENASMYTCSMTMYPYHISGIVTIANCPNNFILQNISALCKKNIQHFEEVGPVVVDESGKIYQNKYCAICHGVTKTTPFELVFTWPFGSLYFIHDISDEDKLNMLLNSRYIQFVTPVNVTVRSCFIEDLLQESHSNTGKCQSHFNPVRVNGDLYRNSYCIPGDVKSQIVCVIDWYNKIIPHGFFSFLYSAFPLKVVFTLGEPQRNCVGGQGMSTTNKCVVIQHYTNYRLSIKYYLYASESLNQTQLEEALVLYLITFQSVSFIAEPAIIEAQLNNNIDTIIATVAFTIKLSLTMTEINLIENRFRGITWNMKIDNNFIQANVKQNLTSENPSKLTVLKVGRWSPPYNIEYIMNELPDTNFSYIESVLYFSDICEEFNVDFKTIKAVKTVVHLGNHSCISNVANFNDRDGFVDLTTYVTYSCFSISVVALTIMTILNRRIRKVKSIPISNLENLAVSIIAANFFFMFGIGANDIQSVCYVIGIVLHYIWLLEFVFMSTSVLFIVINLLQLKSNMAHRPTRSMRYRMFISLFGLLSPSLLVIPAVIVDVLGKDELSPGYNGEVCFPTKYPGNMIFFLGPVFLSITINFISLVLFIGYIVMTSSSIGNVTKSSTYSHAFVFLRITIVSGIFWINGIVATFYENEIFNYIFILLCGLQGLFISLASLTSTAMKEIKKI